MNRLANSGRELHWIGGSLDQHGHHRAGRNGIKHRLHFLIQPQLANVAHHACNLERALLGIQHAQNQLLPYGVLACEEAARQRLVNQDAVLIAF